MNKKKNHNEFKKNIGKNSPNPKVHKKEDNSLQTLFRVEGYSAIIEYFTHRPRAIHSVFFSEDDMKRFKKENSVEVDAQLLRKVNESVGENYNASNGKFFAKDGKSSWAFVQHQTIGWNNFLEHLRAHPQKLLLICDHIQDPRNLGAIVRSCAFFGVRYIIVPERRQSMLSDWSVQSAQGGFAHCDIVNTVNLARACERLKELGFWIVGADMNAPSIRNFKHNQDQKTALVLGGESEGISRLVADTCDELVSIPGAAVRVESLNVSVAAGILLQNFFTPNYKI